ncbi:MAG: CHRD domain-containing protein [Deltaproteobacteria bacterium]|nr:CHRD domain-containing protein [Deltaproteobacteria bacterium]
METRNRFERMGLFIMIIALLVSGVPASAEDPDYSNGVLSLPRVTVEKSIAFNNVTMTLDLEQSTFQLLTAEGDLTITTRTALNGGEENPPVLTEGAAMGVMVVNTQTRAIEGTVLIRGLSDVTVAHIHEGAVGVNGPIIIPLTGDGDIRVVPPDTFLTEEQFQSFLSGGLYVNVHTETNPGGEIRGQISPDLIDWGVASLTGDQENPPVTSMGSALGVMSVNFKTREVSGYVSVQGLQGITAAHIHRGAPDVNGPIIVPLEGSDSMFTVPEGSLFSELDLARFYRGELYFNVHTEDHLGGEIRGQIHPAVR